MGMPGGKSALLDSDDRLALEAVGLSLNAVTTRIDLAILIVSGARLV
jgi:hypothetical protein